MHGSNGRERESEKRRLGLRTHSSCPQVREGFDIIVAGSGFGSGSSREEAVRAILGAGVQCVIARSYAFIYGRNQSNMGLLGIVINDGMRIFFFFLRGF